MDGSLYVNQSFCKIVGYTEDELKDKTLEGITHPDDIKISAEAIQSLLDRKTSVSRFEKRYLKKDGNVAWVDISIHLSRDQQDTPQFFISVTIDISHRIEAEEKLKKSEEQLREILNNLQDAFFRTDMSGRITMVSPSTKRMFGYEPSDELVGQLSSMLYYDSAERDDMIEILRNAGQVVDFIVRGKRKNGTSFWVSMNVQFIKDDQEQILGTDGMIRDITERKQAEMDLIKAKHQAEENNSLRSALLNNMSHEIRTPMNAIMGFSDLMKDANPDEKDVYSDIINKSSIQLLALIDDVILLSRLQSEEMPLRKSIFKPADLVADVSLMFSLEKGSKGLVVRPAIPENFAEFVISADYKRIRQVLTNLVSNAVKYTFSGSVEIGFERKGPQIEFYVKDTGIGIPESEIKKIFETFYRSEQAISLAIRGTGLGLNIASKLVGVLGGRLEVESEHQVGSRFSFTIPCEEYLQENVVKRETPGFKKQLNKLKILIVDDEQFNLELLAILLKDKVKRVDVASNGKEAVEMALKDAYHLVIMDLKMPVMGGIEATKIIKNMYPFLPIIAQTAYALPEEKELAMLAGFDDFITKPIDKETILMAVSKFC
jgi:PAS domain S-box-containing protein